MADKLRDQVDEVLPQHQRSDKSKNFAGSRKDALDLY